MRSVVGWLLAGLVLVGSGDCKVDGEAHQPVKKHAKKMKHRVAARHAQADAATSKLQHTTFQVDASQSSRPSALFAPKVVRVSAPSSAPAEVINLGPTPQGEPQPPQDSVVAAAEAGGGVPVHDAPVTPDIDKQGRVVIADEGEDPLMGQKPAGKTGHKIQDIVIKGNGRIESDTILAYIPLKKGDVIDETGQQKATEALFETGYFRDVHVHLEKGILYVSVEENPMINRIAFEGNDKIKDDVLKQEIRLKPREVISRVRAQEAQQHILEIYRRVGRLGAKVDVKTIELDSNRVDLIFEISEGSSSVVRKIVFIGNKHFSSRQLEDIIQTKRTKWYRFWATDDMYDPERFISDQQALRQFYLNHGFADFRIVSATAELSQDQQNFFLTFTVEEGPVFTFGSHKFDVKIPNLPTEGLDAQVAHTPGDTYSAHLVEKTIRQATDSLGAKGYAFVSIDPHTNKDREKKSIDMGYEIREASHVYIEKIVFIGNDYTHDSVIRRELPIREGDAYDAQKIKKAERNLKDLNYFKTVTVDTEPGSAHDQVRLIIKVEEQPTGELMFSGGYSTMDGPLGSIRIVQRNFRGMGDIVHGDLTVARKRQDIGVGFIRPHFMDRRLTLSTGVFHSRSTRHSAFHQINTGGNVGLSYPLTENLSQSVSYLMKKEDISHVSISAPAVLQRQKGRFYTSQVSQTLAYDKRDAKIAPRSGYIASVSNAYAGVGGTTQFVKTDLALSLYHPVGEESVLCLKGGYGRMDRRKRAIRIPDAIFVGADSFRGFEYGGVGPRDRYSRDSLGATRYYLGTAEMIVPIGLPSEFGVKGALFSDFGSAWRPPVYSPNMIDNRKMRASVGMGIMVQLPIGPIRLDYALPVRQDKYDETQRILLSFSTEY